MSEVTNPHDHFFRETLARPGVARSFLEQYLPAEVRAVLDVSEPTLVQDSFVDAELRSHRADLLYRVGLKGGHEAYVYVLFEHKSVPDRWVAFQLLRYMVRIWERNLRERGELWPIVPLVVYHGRERWWVKRGFGALVEGGAALEEYVPDYRYLLCDLTGYSDEELRGEVLLQVALLTLKYVFRPELAERLPELMGMLRELAERETGLEYVETVLRYLTQAAVYVDADELGRVVTETFPEEGEALMSTIAQRWIERGVQQGWQKGWQEGLRQGKQEGLLQGKQEGLQEGIREGLLAGIRLGLKLRFGSRGLLLLPEIYRIKDVEVLRAVHDGIEMVSTPDELAVIWHLGEERGRAPSDGDDRGT